MALTFVGVRDAGVIADERLVFRANTETELGDYLIFRTDVAEEMNGVLAGTFTLGFFFPAQKIKPGDLVILYTKIGSRREKANDRGRTSHFFYWDQTKPLWSDRSKCAVLAELKTWLATLQPLDPDEVE